MNAQRSKEHSEWPAHSVCTWLFAGSLLGALLGALDALQSIFGSYAATQTLFAQLRFIAWASISMAFAGAVSGLAMVGLQHVPNKRADLFRQIFIGLLALATGLVIFLNIFHFAPFFGVPLAGAHGFFKPVTTGIIAWFAISIAAGLASNFLFKRVGRLAWIMLI